MLRTALGPAIGRLLEDPAVVEVMLNPDGRLWVDRLAGGLADTGTRLSAADGERIVRLVAHHVGAEVHGRSPRVSAELPATGERFEGLLPPVVAAPAFAIRKPAVAVFRFADATMRHVYPVRDYIVECASDQRHVLLTLSCGGGFDVVFDLDVRMIPSLTRDLAGGQALLETPQSLRPN